MEESSSFLSFRDNRDLRVLREAQHLRNETSHRKQPDCTGARTREKDLCDLMTMRKFHKYRRRILAVQDSRFNMKIAGEIEMPVDGFSFLRRQFGNISTRQ